MFHSSHFNFKRIVWPFALITFVQNSKSTALMLFLFTIHKGNNIWLFQKVPMVFIWNPCNHCVYFLLDPMKFKWWLLLLSSMIQLCWSKDIAAIEYKFWSPWYWAEFHVGLYGRFMDRVNQIKASITRRNTSNQRVIDIYE